MSSNAKTVEVMVFNRLVSAHCDVVDDATLVAEAPFMVIELPERRSAKFDSPTALIRKYHGYAIPTGTFLRDIRFSEPTREDADPSHVIASVDLSEVVDLGTGSNEGLKALFAKYLADL